MVMKKYTILLLLTLFVAACSGGDDDGDVVTPSNERIEVDARDLTLSGDGQEVNLKITANCSWTITILPANCDWLMVTPMSGANSEIIKLKASKNSLGSERIAKLTIEGKEKSRSVTVTQAKSSESQEPSSSGEPSAGDNQPPT